MAQMTTQDIVKNSDTVKESGQDWEKVYATLHTSVKSPDYRIFRTNNTLFWVHILSPGVAQVFAFNADPKEKLIPNILEFLKTMKIANYTTLNAVMTNFGLFKRLQREGYQVEIEQLPSSSGPAIFKGTIHV